MQVKGPCRTDANCTELRLLVVKHSSGNLEAWRILRQGPFLGSTRNVVGLLKGWPNGDSALRSAKAST